MIEGPRVGTRGYPWATIILALCQSLQRRNISLQRRNIGDGLVRTVPSGPVQAKPVRSAEVISVCRTYR